MSDGWAAEVAIDCASEAEARRLHRVLGPESSREVPRARASLTEPTDRTLSIHLETRDTGALRAGLQTFLGWVQLESETVRAAART